MSRFVSFLLLAVFAAQISNAEKNTLLETRISKTGSPDFVQMFDSELPDVFQEAKGDWKIENGVLTGCELKSDQHAAVLSLRIKNRDSVVRFSFKMDDQTDGFNFSLNHEGGHLFRASLSPTRLSINLDRDKKDPKSKTVALARQKASFKRGQWYTMQIEMVGDTVVVQTDNGVVVKARHPRLDTDKPNYRFVMRNRKLSIDDLRIWSLKER